MNDDISMATETAWNRARMENNPSAIEEAIRVEPGALRLYCRQAIEENANS